MADQLSMETFYRCREWSEVRSRDSDALLPQGHYKVLLANFTCTNHYTTLATLS